MRKKPFKTIRLFLKLILLFHVYLHHQFTEASENDSSGTIEKCGIREGTGFKDQNIKNETNDESVLERPKRPARLLPLRMILGKEKNKTESENSTSTRFYGPATNCEELLKIGYTRNGFYLVKGNATSNNNHVEMVDCMFKNPNGGKEVKEKRLGFIRLLPRNAVKFHQSRFIQNFSKVSKVEADETALRRPVRPVRLLPSYLLYGNDTSDTEENHIVRFYGPPCNCSELGKLGYTLNGYYLVNGSKSSRQIEIILCRFKLAPGENENNNEESIGYITLDQIKAVTDQFQSTKEQLSDSSKEMNISKSIPRNLRPARILPNKYYIKGKENGTEAKKVQDIYRNPASCNDVRILGYTLNGYYLVNSSNIAHRFGVVFCQFKLPPGAGSKTEDLLGFINLLDKPIDEIKKFMEEQGGNQIGFSTRDLTTLTTPTTTDELDSDSSEVETSVASSTSKDFTIDSNNEITNTRTTTDSGDESSEVTETPTTLATTQLFSTGKGKMTKTRTTKSHEFLDENEKNAKCIHHHGQQLYYLKNNETTCLALSKKKDQARRVIRVNCSNDRLKMQWMKQESINKNLQGAFHICQSLDETTLECLDVPQNFKIYGNNYVPLDLNSYISAHTTVKSRYQQWRLNTKTNQIVNVETRLCLTSFESKPISNTFIDKVLPVGARTCEKVANVKQKWFFDPIPKC